MKQEF